MQRLSIQIKSCGHRVQAQPKSELTQAHVTSLMCCSYNSSCNQMLPSPDSGPDCGNLHLTVPLKYNRPKLAFPLFLKCKQFELCKHSTSSSVQGLRMCAWSATKLIALQGNGIEISQLHLQQLISIQWYEVQENYHCHLQIPGRPSLPLRPPLTHAYAP